MCSLAIYASTLSRCLSKSFTHYWIDLFFCRWVLGVSFCILVACAPSRVSLRPHGLQLAGSSVHGIFLAKILEWVAVSYSRGSSWPRDLTHVFCVSCIGRRILYHPTTWLLTLYQISNLQILSTFLWVAFLFCEQCLLIHKILKFSWSWICFFFCYLWVWCHIRIQCPKSWSFCPVFF